LRKQLKKAADHIGAAKVLLEQASQDQKIPSVVRLGAGKIASALVIDINELEKLKTYITS
jgi:hypothetical protein